MIAPEHAWLNSAGSWVQFRCPTGRVFLALIPSFPPAFRSSAWIAIHGPLKRLSINTPSVSHITQHHPLSINNKTKIDLKLFHILSNKRFMILHLVILGCLSSLQWIKHKENNYRMLVYTNFQRGHDTMFMCSISAGIQK